MTAIAAMSRNRVIGKGGRLPWQLPEELRWFRQATLGHAVLMGRRTFDALGGKPLGGRLNLVATRRSASGFAPAENVEIIPDLSAFRPEPYETLARQVFVIGGEEIYRLLLPRCAELLLTLVNREIEGGEAFFPPFEDQFRLAGVLRRGPEFEVRRYRARVAHGSPAALPGPPLPEQQE